MRFLFAVCFCALVGIMGKVWKSFFRRVKYILSTIEALTADHGTKCIYMAWVEGTVNKTFGQPLPQCPTRPYLQAQFCRFFGN